MRECFTFSNAFSSGVRVRGSFLKKLSLQTFAKKKLSSFVSFPPLCLSLIYPSFQRNNTSQL